MTQQQNTQAETGKVETTGTKRTEAVSGLKAGCGYLIMWSGSLLHKTAMEIQTDAKDAGLPQEVWQELMSHTVTAAVGLARNDSRWGKIRHNDHKVEAKVLHVDTNGNITIEFLGYSKSGNDLTARGRRDHLDRVCIDSKGQWLYSGSTPMATSFKSVVEHHLDYIGGSVIYDKVSKKLLTQMRSFRVARNCYYVAASVDNESLINNWDGFFSKIGYELIALTQMADSRTRKGLASRATSDLGNRLDVVNAKVQEWKKKNRANSRSQETVLTSLAEILKDAENVENQLNLKLEIVRAAVENAKKEALGIINNQAPTGVAPVVFTAIKTLLEKTDKVLQQTEHGPIYLFKVEEMNTEGLWKGDKLTSAADKAIRSCGFYSFASQGMVILRPLAELKA